MYFLFASLAQAFNISNISITNLNIFSNALTNSFICLKSRCLSNSMIYSKSFVISGK